MITAIEWLFLGLLTTLSSLIALYVGYRIAKPRMKRTLTGYIPVITKAVGAHMSKLGEEALENVDLGQIASQIGGGGGNLEGLGAIGNLLGGGGGGIGDLLSLLGQFSGQRTKKGGHSPGK